MSDLTKATARTPLQICLCCGYSLAGLPVAHQCPECGLAYDPHSFAIEVKREESAGKVALVLLCMGVGVFLYLVPSSPGRGVREIALPLIWLVFIAWYIFYGRFGRRLIVDPVGLHLASRGRVLHSVLWGQLKTLYFSKIDGGLVARTTGGKRFSLCRNAKFAKECRKDIEHAWNDYRNAPQMIARQVDQPPL